MIEGLLSISFDDGFLTDYSVAFPEMQSRGVVGTSFICGLYIELGYSNRLTRAQINEMIIAGWDFQCHTLAHANISTITEMSIHRQFFKNIDFFNRNGWSKPLHHAYPYGMYNDLARSTLKKYYKSGRRGLTVASKNLQDSVVTDFSLLNAMDAQITTQLQLDSMKNILDQAIVEKKVMMPYWHELTGDKLTYFISFLDYAKSTGVRFVTQSELYEILVANQ